MNNKGITLIEIIVVMAIVGILVGSSFVAIQYIQFGNTKKCVAKIEDELDRLLVETMSKKEKRYFYLFKTADGYFVTLDKDKKRENLEQKEAIKVAGSPVVIEADGQSINEENMIKIGYQKEGGAFSNDAYCSQITIEGNGTYRLHLVKDTGLHYLEP